VLSTLRTEAQYKKSVKLLDMLIDEVSEKGDPQIESLIDTLGTLIKDYEDRKIEEPEGDAVGMSEISHGGTQSQPKRFDGAWQSGRGIRNSARKKTTQYPTDKGPEREVQSLPCGFHLELMIAYRCHFETERSGVEKSGGE